MKLLTWLALTLCASMAFAEEDIWTKTINNENNGTWKFQPEKPKPKHFKDEAVPGGYAFRVKTTKGANPWDMQASSPITGAIDAGDVIMLVYYARAAEPAEGGSSLAARIQSDAPPYTAVLEFSTPITGEWKNYCAHRVATATLAEKKSSVSIHLATAAQVIELGPVFVFNFGKEYDRKKLKGCDG